MVPQADYYEPQLDCGLPKRPLGVTGSPSENQSSYTRYRIFKMCYPASAPHRHRLFIYRAYSRSSAEERGQHVAIIQVSDAPTAMVLQTS